MQKTTEKEMDGLLQYPSRLTFANARHTPNDTSVPELAKRSASVIRHRQRSVDVRGRMKLVGKNETNRQAREQACTGATRSRAEL